MPHFAAETFVSQYFWLVVTFILFYIVVNTYFIPNVAKTLKIRKLVVSNDSSLNTDTSQRDAILSKSLTLKVNTIDSKSLNTIKYIL
jgi:F0F1-type ATP synthase membrane subunit b/b'